jgi:hypothetical protein
MVLATSSASIGSTTQLGQTSTMLAELAYRAPGRAGEPGVHEQSNEPAEPEKQPSEDQP